MYQQKLILFLILLNLLQLKTIAQPTIDTMKWCLQQKPHLFGKIDTRQSFIYNNRVKIIGIKGGLNYGKRLQFGLGYNQLYSPSKKLDKQLYFFDTNGTKDSITSKLKLFYFSIHTEYIFYKNNHWQLSMPLQLGVGDTYYKYQLFNKKQKTNQFIVFIYEPAISIEYKIVKWAGVGADIGFRLMATKQKEINQQFNSPTYAFKFLIYYDEILKILFPNNKWQKKLKIIKTE
ncbi:MAG: hypothetical protein ABI315_00690 [Bacteroidia bacterium]